MKERVRTGPEQVPTNRGKGNMVSLGVLLKFIDDPLLVTTQGGCITYANDAAAELMSIDRDTLRGQRIEEYLEAALFERLSKAHGARGPGSAMTTTTTVRTAPGESARVTVRSALIVAGAPRPTGGAGEGTPGESEQRFVLVLRRSGAAGAGGRAEDDRLGPEAASVPPEAGTRRETSTSTYSSERDILEKSDYHRALFEHSPDAHFVTLEDGRILDVNPAGAALLGYGSPDEVRGRDSQDFWRNPDDGREIRKMVDKRGVVKDHEITLVRKDGRELYCSQTATRVYDGRLGMTVYQGTIQDIGARIQTERETLQRTVELAEANRKLTETQNELAAKQKLATVGRLSAGIAHEINNPLGFVRSNVSALRRYIRRIREFFEEYTEPERDAGPEAEADAAPDFDAEAAADAAPVPAPDADADPDADESRFDRMWRRHKVGTALENFDELFDSTDDGLSRIAAIVEQLKGFSRAGTDEQVEDYDLVSGIEMTLSIAAHHYRDIATVERRLEPVPTIFCNANEIHQALWNIVVNAAQAIREAGGGTGKSLRGGVATSGDAGGAGLEENVDGGAGGDREVRRTAGTGRIRVETTSDHTHLYCNVIDNGPGMPGNVRARAFDPFFTTRPAGQGSGLGLSVTYDIVVNRHGGALELDTNEWGGTTVRMALPVGSTLRGGSRNG